jgi:ribosomal protein S12 methylthiotransferase
MPAPMSFWSTRAAFSTAPRKKALKRSARAIAENGKVVVTGCMGKEADVIRARFPQVLAITGPAAI